MRQGWGGLKALRSAAIDAYKGMNGTWVPCPALGADVEIRKQSSGKVKTNSADRRKLRLIPYLPEIIGKGKKFKPSALPYLAEERGYIKLYHYLRTAVRFAGEELAVRIVIREDTDGQYHYDHTVHGIGEILDSATENERDACASLCATNYKSGELSASDQLAGGRPCLPTQGVALDSAVSVPPP
jgi:hypothetical protein